MQISARVHNREGQHDVTLSTDGTEHPVVIPPRATGFGSSANGGELLFLALATCYCNDLYREAAQRNMRVESVEVEVAGEFGAPGEPAKNVTYRAKVTAHGRAADIRALLAHTDRVAEVQNTLRVVTPVMLAGVEVIARRARRTAKVTRR
jgi:organic hydroperoxide reductase OsmC/OhrA